LTSFLGRYWRLILLILGIILFIWLLYWLRTMILPFAVGLVLAYLLTPLVLWLEKKLPPRRKWPNFRRILSVIISLILLVAIVGAFGYFIVETVRTASLSLLESAPYFIGQSLIEIQEWFNSVIESLPMEIQQQINAEIVNAGVTLGNNIRSALMGAVTSIPATFVTILGFAVLPFFVFYLLKDSDKLTRGFYSFFPERSIIHVRNVMAIVERVLGWYIRAQLMLGLIVGYFTFIGLYILDVPYKLALALLAGVGEMVPIVGPWISGGIAVVVTLAVVPDKAIWVAVLFVCVQLLENNLFVPKIQSAYLRIHPAVMIFLLILGTYIAGFWGLLVIGPLTATLYEIYKYIRNYYQQPRLLEPVEPVEPG
jgi:predicted PurR-regulated permease PerM